MSGTTYPQGKWVLTRTKDATDGSTRAWTGRVEGTDRTWTASTRKSLEAQMQASLGPPPDAYAVEE